MHMIFTLALVKIMVQEVGPGDELESRAQAHRSRVNNNYVDHFEI